MPVRKVVERLRTPTEELDRRDLESFCRSMGLIALDEIKPRERAAVVGEIRTVRIVPRAGADALEAIVLDGRGAVTAVFLGRRKIRGIKPGRRLFLEGMVVQDGRQLAIFNPLYELFP